MKHDFENARRGAVIQATGKTRVTMYLDDDVIEHFRQKATANGRGYQTEINSALRGVIDGARSAVAAKGEIVRINDLYSSLEGLYQRVGKIEHGVGHIESLMAGVSKSSIKAGDVVFVETKGTKASRPFVARKVALKRSSKRVVVRDLTK